MGAFPERTSAYIAEQIQQSFYNHAISLPLIGNMKTEQFSCLFHCTTVFYQFIYLFIIIIRALAFGAEITLSCSDRSARNVRCNE